MPDQERGTDRAGRRNKRFRTALEELCVYQHTWAVACGDGV